jgi:hypothetical protein
MRPKPKMLPRTIAAISVPLFLFSRSLVDCKEDRSSMEAGDDKRADFWRGAGVVGRVAPITARINRVRRIVSFILALALKYVLS